MDTKFVENLRALPEEQWARVIAGEFSDHVAATLGVQANSIDIEAPFEEIAPAFKDIPMRWHQLLAPWAKQHLGFRAFHLYEASLSNSIAELSRYLAIELRPIPVPQLALGHHNTFWKWGWGEPKPFQGESQVQGNNAFVLGSGRSGTSLFRSMLACHEQIFAPNELHLLYFDDMGQRRSDIQRLWQQWMDVGLIETLQTEFGMTYWDAILKIKQFADESMPVEDVYKLIQSKMSGRWLVDKTPAYSRHPDWLNRAEQMFDKPRYLFMTRHPYAVMDSFIRSRFYRYSSSIWGLSSNNHWHKAELYWSATNRNILDFLKQIPESRQMRISYEDLMQDTANVQQAACQFLSIPYDGSILDPYNQPGHEVASNLRERNRVVHTNAEVWRDKRPPHPLSELTHQVAEELGYPLS